MAEPGFYENCEWVEPGDTRCRSYPRTCAEVQADTPTSFLFCDFCVYGPPADPPSRRELPSLTLEEAESRVAKTEGERGDKLREAVVLMQEADRG